MLQNAMSRLRECCMGLVVGRKLEHWSTKPCVFPCKVAAAGNERYLLCAAVAAVQPVVVHVCVILRAS